MKVTGNRKDLTGQRFGHLVAVEPRPNSRWLFRCDCGQMCVKRSNNVVYGTTRSCGCARRAKGRDKLAHAWEGRPFFERLSWDGISIRSWADMNGTTPAETMRMLKEERTLRRPR